MNVPDRGWLLPEQIDGHDLVCVTLRIPNERQYMAAFRGCLKMLENWWNWEKSGVPGDTRATRAARYWRELIFEYLVIDECMPMITDIRIDNCDLQVQFDSSGQWVTIGDLSACATGEQGPPGQPGADGVTPEPVWQGTELAWDLDEDGIADTPFVDLVGPQGAAGVDGQDGECPPDCGGPVDYPSEPPPYPPGQDPPDIRCSAATKTATVLMDSIVEIEGKVNQALGFTEFLFVVTTIGVQAFFAGAIVNAYRDIWDLVKGGDTFDAQVIRDGVKCEAYCILGEDGLWDRDKVLALADALEQRAVDDADVRYAAVGLYTRLLDHNGINYSERVDPIPGADCSGCDCGDDPPMLVSFDVGGWHDYELIQHYAAAYDDAIASIDAQGGNPGGAMVSGQDNDCGYSGGCGAASIRIYNLPSVSVSAVSFDIRSNQAAPGIVAVDVFTYDTDPAAGIVEAPSVPNVNLSDQWQTITVPLSSSVGIREVRIYTARTNTQSGNLRWYIDNIAISEV